jgi:hypothetical protein
MDGGKGGASAPLLPPRCAVGPVWRVPDRRPPSALVFRPCPADASDAEPAYEHEAVAGPSPGGLTQRLATQLGRGGAEGAAAAGAAAAASTGPVGASPR